MTLQVEGRRPLNNIEVFLVQNVEHDGQQPIEFQLGFQALRRHQAQKLARDFDIELGNATAMTEIVPILTAAWNQGRFPAPKAPVDAIAERVKNEVMAELTSDPALLRALLVRAEGETASAPQSEAFVSPAPPQSVDTRIKTPMELYLEMDWGALRAEAQRHGIDTKAKGATREAIIKALLATKPDEPADGDDAHVPSSG